MPNTSDRKRVVRVHITQDPFGYWMMTFELDDGELVLASYRIERFEHAVQHVDHPHEIGLPEETEFVISDPGIPLRAGAPEWKKPEPRRASPPCTVRKKGVH